MCANLDSDSLGFASWRVAFAVEGGLMAPVALLCLFLTNGLGGAHGERGAGQEGGEGDKARGSLWSDAVRILSNKIWLCAVLGYGAFTFSVGAVAVWGPYYVQRAFGVPLDEADLYFGVVAVSTGLLGTAAGGVVMDVVTRRMGGDIMSSSLLVTVLLTMVAWPFCLITFNVSTYSSFYFFMFIGQFCSSPFPPLLLSSPFCHALCVSNTSPFLALFCSITVPATHPLSSLSPPRGTVPFALHPEPCE